MKVMKASTKINDFVVRFANVNGTGSDGRQAPDEGYLMKNERVYALIFASVYPHYVKKAEKKGRTREELDEIIRWLTGYNQAGLERQLSERNDMRTFFDQAPKLNPNVSLIKGVVCGIRVEDIEDPLMQ